MIRSRTTSGDVRLPSVAGLFYPETADALREDLSRLYLKVEPAPRSGVVRGIIAPHAGYMYSGYTAACGYARLAGASYDTVIIVSPSHREFFEGVSVYPGSAYQTPLGKVEIDATLRERMIAACPYVKASGQGHGEEHAIEVHIPFLQKLLPSFRLLPLVIGHQSREVCFALGGDLANLVRGLNILMVASTDLSHYYPSPVARTLDSALIRDLERFDAEGLMDDLEGGTAEACGGGPTVAVMTALKALGSTVLEVVHRCNSGDITGETESVVGYVSAVAYG